MNIFKSSRENITQTKVGKKFSHQEWQGCCRTCGAEYKAAKENVKRRNTYPDDEYGWTTIIDCDCGNEVFMHLALVEN